MVPWRKWQPEASAENARTLLLPYTMCSLCVTPTTWNLHSIEGVFWAYLAPWGALLAVCSWLTIDKLPRTFEAPVGTMVGSQAAVIMLGNSNRSLGSPLFRRDPCNFHPGSLQQPRQGSTRSCVSLCSRDWNSDLWETKAAGARSLQWNLMLTHS